jgi:uncharacterized membrane protein YdbT with pleckstrin-like domain
MSYVDRVLQPGEHVVARGRLHWVVYAGGVFAFLAAIIIAIGAYQAPGVRLAIQILALLLALFGVALLVRAWWHRWGLEIAVTNRRVIYKTGVIRRRTLEMNLEQIESVQVDQSILGRLLGYGDISVHGTGEGLEVIRLIADPISVRNAVTAR